MSQKKQKTSNRGHDLERPQMNSNDLKRPQLTSKESSPNNETVKLNTPKKNKLKVGANIDINDKYLDEILHNRNL